MVGSTIYRDLEAVRLPLVPGGMPDIVYVPSAPVTALYTPITTVAPSTGLAPSRTVPEMVYTGAAPPEKNSSKPVLGLVDISPSALKKKLYSFHNCLH
jgi:hypothetical protein